jgi:myotubularin-related protein 1/2
MGHGVDKHSDQDRSPIFVQFIDCVWQIQQHNEKIFEFNENFLLTILKHVFTCQFGTFLYNSEYEREKHVGHFDRTVKSLSYTYWIIRKGGKNQDCFTLVLHKQQ